MAGAAFNSLNRRLTIWRSTRLRTKRSRLTEALAVAAITALASCALPWLLPCVPIPPPLPQPPAPPPPAPSPPWRVPRTDALAAAAAALDPLAADPLAADPFGAGPFDAAHSRYVHDAHRCSPPRNPLQNLTHHFVCGEVGLESPLVHLLLAEKEMQSPRDLPATSPRSPRDLPAISS